MMKRQRKPSQPDSLDLRYRRQRRRERERRIKWLLVLIGILAIILIAVIFRRYALKHLDNYKAPIENPTYWYGSETEEGIFSTITPTITLSPTATVPSATPTATRTMTPTITLTPTLTPTPKLRPRKTVEGNAADLLMQAESTLAAMHAEAEKENEAEIVSDSWFELLGEMTLFDAAEVYPNSDCSWMGAAGVLIDNRGDPQIGCYVQIGLPDGTIEETLSGLFPGYGESGYELTIARPIRAFDEPIWIRVLDPAGHIASEKIYFRPNSDCAKSLTMINFRRVR